MKTEAQIQIEKLEEEIKARQEQAQKDKAKLAATKVFLTQLKKQQKKPFAETKFARGFLHAAKFCTSPLASLHEKSSAILDDPQGLRRSKLEAQAEAIIELAEKAEPDTKEGSRLSDMCAKYAMEIEAEMARDEWPKISKLLTRLQEQSGRLMSKETKDRAEADKKKLEGLFAAGPTEAEPVTVN